MSKKFTVSQNKNMWKVSGGYVSGTYLPVITISDPAEAIKLCDARNKMCAKETARQRNKRAKNMFDSTETSVQRILKGKFTKGI